MLSVKNWFIAGLLIAATCPTGCASSPFWPTAPTHQIVPLPEYREMYAQAEQCVGLKGNFDTLSFYIVDNLDGSTEFGEKYYGTTGVYRDDKIFILSGLEHDAPTVVHEMLHHILSYYISPERNAAHDYPLAFFGEGACDLSP